MFGDMGKMMKQVAEMKAKMKQAEKELRDAVVTGASKDSNIEVTVSGKMELKGVRVKTGLSDAKKLEKQIFEAVDSALKQAATTAADKLSGVTGGIKIPGL